MQTIDEQTIFNVETCEFEVRGVETREAMNLPCTLHYVRHDLGTFQWTTTADAGSLVFVVNLFGPNRVVFGSGQSDPVAITPGKTLSTSVFVTAVAAAPTP